VRNCVRRLPQVFVPTQGRASGEQPQEETTVEPRPNGPLFVRGLVRIVDPDGELIREDTRVALCRCGASQNKPFCDGSHLRISFTT
jgi:hypothetical protein